MSQKAGAALANITTGSSWRIILNQYLPTSEDITARWTDLAFGLSGIKDNLSLLILQVKYALQAELSDKLHMEIIKYVQQISHEKQWLKRNIKVQTSSILLAHQHSVQKISKLAYEEIMAPSVCPTCKGAVAVVLSNGQKILCEDCSGSGKGHWDKRARVKSAGITSSNWDRRGWDERYKSIYLGLVQKEQAGLKIVYDRVFKYYTEEEEKLD